jgi:hypothetical protein
MSQGGGYFWDKTCSPFSLKSTAIPLYKNGFCENKNKKRLSRMDVELLGWFHLCLDGHKPVP